MKLHISEAEKVGMRLRVAFTTRPPDICRLQWSPDGETLVSQHWDIKQNIRNTCFWDWKKAEVLFELAPAQTRTSNSFDFTWSPAGDRVAMSAEWEGQSLRDTDVQPFAPGETGVEVRRIVGKSEAVFIPLPADYSALTFVHWLPEGDLIAAASERTFRILDANTGESVRDLDGELGEDATALSISPDGRTAIGATGLGIVKVFDLPDWEVKDTDLAPISHLS